MTHKRQCRCNTRRQLRRGTCVGGGSWILLSKHFHDRMQITNPEPK